jgi:uncharacterized protein (DUF4415 family)
MRYRVNLCNKQLTEIITICRQRHSQLRTSTNPMPKTLYSPRLSDDVVRSLYREGQRRQMPMTRLADSLLRQALGKDQFHKPVPVLCLAEGELPAITETHAA